MKRIINLFYFFIVIAAKAIAQQDSLTLLVRSEYVKDDSANSFNIRVYIYSRQQQPIKLYSKPLYPLICCMKSETGVEIEQLDSNCFRPIVNCADCDYFNGLPEYEKEDLKTLNYGDTLGFKDDIGLFNRYGINGKPVGFYGNYRCRAYWFYYERGKKRKIISNWIYINFPVYK